MHAHAEPPPHSYATARCRALIGHDVEFSRKERQSVFARHGNVRQGFSGNEVLNCGVVIVSYVEVANSVGRLSNSLNDIQQAFIYISLPALKSAMPLQSFKITFKKNIIPPFQMVNDLYYIYFIATFWRLLLYAL